METKESAIAYIYQSYLRAEKYLDRDQPDSCKRKPQLTKEIIQGICEKPAILVTGSKGKGSVACMISQILQTQKCVGMMTSPHLAEFNERFCVDGENIADGELIRILTELKPQFDLVEAGLSDREYISPVGIQAAMALCFFRDWGTDINVFECGKGAKYDDVNQIPHQFAVITPVFLEHTRELGRTVKEIAEDKAAIITRDTEWVFVGRQSSEALQIILERAQKLGVGVSLFGRDYNYKNLRYESNGMKVDVAVGHRDYPNMEIPLLGEHQACNLAMTMAVCEKVLGILDTELCRQKLLGMRWPGRLEVISTNPLIVLDACINRVSCRFVKDVLRRLDVKGWTAIVGIPDDKDYLGVIEEIAEIADNIILTRANNPHYHFSRRQEAAVLEKGWVVSGTANVEKALEMARQSENAICILGTTALVAEVSMKKERLFLQSSLGKKP